MLSVFVFDCLFFVVGCLDLASGFLTTLVFVFLLSIVCLLFLGRRDLSSGYPSFLTREKEQKNDENERNWKRR